MRFALRVSSRGVLWGGIAMLSTLILLNGLLSYAAVRQLIWNAQWVERTRAVETELERLELLIANAEIGQRGYLLTNRPEYLQPYATALQEFPYVVARLRRMLADNPAQVRRLEVEDLGSRKLDELAEFIALQKEGQASAARAALDSGLGASRAQEVYGAVEGMKAEQDGLLKIRITRARTARLLAYGTLGISSLTALLAIVSFGVVLSRSERSREEASAAIREREEWLSTTLASIGDAVIVTDTTGKVSFLNPVAQVLLQCSEADAIGRPVMEVFRIFNESTGAPADLPIDRVVHDGFLIGLGNHTVLRRPDGTDIPIADSAAPVRGKGGKLIGVVLVFRDISEQRQIEQTLRVSEKLAATGKLAATVAHEVNNPLEAVTNILYLLRGDPGLTAKGHELLAAADDQLARVAHITRQTLSFYRSTSPREPLLVAAACDHILEVYRDKIAAKHVSIEREYDETLTVLGTSGELAQVLSNLVSNALDAVSPGGRISLAVFAGAHNNVFVTVQDDGCGIDPANLDHVFEPFYTTKKDVGTGLGLWVTREIVEKLGGRVSASSDGIGLGAQFALSLPLHEQQENESRASIA